MELTLYQFEGCPFCAKVRTKLAKKGLKYSTVEVPRDDDDPLWALLHDKAGVWTVPVLKAGERWIGESEDIVAFLDTF